MTDYRRTEEEIWDEDDVAEEDRRTNVLAMVASASRKQAPADERVSTVPEPSRERSLAERADESAERAATPVDSLSRFIAEPIGSEGNPSDVHKPGWSLAAMAMIENDVLTVMDGEAVPHEPTGDGDGQVRAQPPALPAAALGAASTASAAPSAPAQPADERAELPSMLLGPAMSTRGDITERVTTIPRTHPLANSIAPGGSHVSIPPGRRSSPRWYFAFGGVGLLLVAGGAALFLQSRGEHHAVVASRTSEAPLEQPLQVLEPAEETVIVLEEPPEPVLLADAVAAPAVESAIAAPEQPDPQPASPVAPRERRKRMALSAPAERPSAEPGAAPEPVSGLRVTVGPVELRPVGNAPASEQAPLPERSAVIEAVNRVAAELRACVGEEHGIADVTLTVRGSGTISHALVEGAFAGSPQGSCLARTLRSVRLPPFADRLLHIAYPLQL